MIDGSGERECSALGNLWSGETGNRKKVPETEEKVLVPSAGT